MGADAVRAVLYRFALPLTLLAGKLLLLEKLTTNITCRIITAAKSIRFWELGPKKILWAGRKFSV